MNLTQLRAFVAIVEHGTFSEAARAVGLSQPAVTMQIQGLETDLGVTLLDRRYRSVQPTEAGIALLPHARAILAEVEAARREVDRVSDTVGGHLEVAVSTTPGQYVLPRLLGPFLARHPDVTISLRVQDTGEVVERVETGRAQLGMTGARTASTKVGFEQMGSDDLVLVCPPSSELGDTPDMEEVVTQSFIMRESGSGTRMVFEDWLRGARIDPADLRVVMELGSGEAIVNAVEGGVGIGVVSAWMAEKALALGTVRTVRAPGFPIRRPLFAVTPRGGLTRAAEALLAHLRESLADRG